MRITSNDILYGPIGPTLRRMTTPMVIGILVMILFQVVDTFFVGLLGTTELAAISFTFPVTFTISNISVGLGIATSVVLANVIGKGETERARRITTDSLLLTLLAVGIVSVIGVATIDPLFHWLGASETTLPLIRDYIGIWYMTVGFIVIPMVGNMAIRATGDTKSPSWMMVLSGFINVLLDPILIFGWGPVPALGIKGAAIATAVAWMSGFCISIWILRVRERLLLFTLPPVRELLAYWRHLGGIGLPIALANMLTPLSAAVLTAFIARYGEHAVAGFGAGSRIEALSIVVCLAITSALSPYMAQNIGAGQVRRAREALRLSLRFAALFQLGIYPVLLLGSPLLAGIFSNDPAVIDVTTMFLWVMPLGFGAFGIVIVVNTAFNAAQQSHKTLISNCIRVFFCYAPGAWLGRWLFDIPGMFIGAVAGNWLAALVVWRMANRTYDQIEISLQLPAVATDAVVDLDAQILQGAQVD